MDMQAEFALFRINGQGCALPLETIKQVMPQPHCSVLPNAPIWLTGLIEVLGQVVPLIDLGLWPEKPELFSVHPTALVIQPDSTVNRWLALRVDDAPVMCLQADFGEIEPHKLPEPIAALAQQQVDYAGQLIALLDTTKLAAWSQS
jgi:chemotaxis signal transduction protein